MLAFKSLGVALIILTGTFCGLKLSGKLTARENKLKGFYLFIREISDRIKTGEELTSIYESKRAEGLITTEGFKVVLCEDALNSQDKKLLTEFFSFLGMGDTNSQISRCEIYSELLIKRLEEAEKEAKEKAKLYTSLGIFSGLFIVILLI